ncbi:MAG: type I methionyl aminopeptidase [Bacteroidia bacterium]|nr:type I methionyl aminopeptidase [Bacteroidia bacterium]MDW8158937.1 type I methionyl aminopeptidase [Bacteroidia bacterium]
MVIKTEEELIKIKKVSEIVGITLKKMQEYAKPGMSAKELDEYGGKLLKEFGAQSAPRLAYNFPGNTCICINKEVAHGIPTENKIFQEGDLINIDVSAEYQGFWADNGASFILGKDLQNLSPLVETSKRILHMAIQRIRPGMKINEIGKLIETEAKKAGYRVIRNLVGHGVGNSLHEPPREIPNFYDRLNTQRFAKNSVIALETFISTHSNYAKELNDGWTLVGDLGGFVAQHEHTLLITDKQPEILTYMNGI